MSFVRVASLEEIPPGTMKSYNIKGREVLVANVKGKIYAMGAICNHARWDLAEGTLDEENAKVVCAGHGAVWDLKTGEGKFVRPLPPEPTYEVKVEDGEIYVKL